ncbi:hypothetical protein [Pedobacter sp. JCM 36344]|uniref:hypothetical protein n=1 Tax=Pedobacter sp. JCM 36344 TaxID=3374280 RepID=UPI00397C48F2
MEQDLLEHLDAFSDTVSLKKGTYNFYRGRDYGFLGDDHTKTLDKAIHCIFGFKSNLISSFISQDETKSEAGKIVNYVKVPYFTNPIIVVDGKVASYKVTEKRFKLDESVYPKQHKMDILRGDKGMELIVFSCYPKIIFKFSLFSWNNVEHGNFCNHSCLNLDNANIHHI